MFCLIRRVFPPIVYPYRAGPQADEAGSEQTSKPGHPVHSHKIRTGEVLIRITLQHFP